MKTNDRKLKITFLALATALAAAAFSGCAKKSDKTLVSELSKTEVTLTDKLALDLSIGKNAFSEAPSNAANVGTLQGADIHGEAYTEDIFKDYELTLVNVLTTWCTYCIQEMPELEKLKNDMADQGVNVVGIVYDTVNPTGEPNEEALKIAGLIQEKTEATFPLLMPDATYLNGRISGITSVPETFFVDKNGNIVSEPYFGARSYDQWKEIVETELANLK